MGDCRIRIVVAKTLFDSLPDDFTNGDDSFVRVATNQKSVSFVRMYSADTTVREVVEENILLNKLYLDKESPGMIEFKTKVISKFALWDCTLNPPRDISSWPVHDFPDLQGFKSKTLHAAGLFPSGTWVAIPKGMAPNTFSDYDSNADVDVQYNSSLGHGGNEIKNASTRGVQFNDPNLRIGNSKSTALLPSQVMETVSNRFAAEEQEEERKKMESPGASVAVLRQHRAQKEVERAAKLEKRIAMLEEQSNNNQANKKKKTSDQVLRMLVKSRATGDKSLKEKDRLYFQCLNLFDDSSNDSNESSAKTANSSKEYRYFSPQDTFAKIANSFSKFQKKECFNEVLCRLSTGQSEDSSQELPVYGRFPVTMRVYEAQSEGYLRLSENISSYFDDILIVRWYKGREDATPLIQDVAVLDSKNQNDDTTAGKDISEETASGQALSPGAATTTAVSPMVVEEKVEDENSGADGTSTFEDIELTDAIQDMDKANKTGTKKATSAKRSAAAVKVRQMKMKSKAKGNKKVKLEDRIFLEVVSISEIGKTPTCESYFLSRNDPIEKILPCIGTSPYAKSTVDDWEFLVPQDDSRYRPIPTTSIRMKEAEEQELLKSFDRIIIRPKNN